MLTGDLQGFSVAELLRLLAATSKTGLLHVETPACNGRIELLEGRIRQATAEVSRAGLARRLLGSGLVTAETLEQLLADHDHLASDLELAGMLVTGDHLGSGQVAASLREQTISAVCTLQQQRGGTFTFAPGAVGAARAAAVAMGVSEVLAAVEERTADLPRLRERTGHVSAVVTIVRPATADSDAPEEALDVLPLIDGRRTVVEVGRLWGRGEYETRSALALLLEAGVIEVQAAGDARIGQLLSARERLMGIESRLGGAPQTDQDDGTWGSPDTSAPLPSVPASSDGVIDLTERRTTPRMALESTMDVDTIRRLIAGIEALA